ncbi:Zinc finger BED domain-containing protein 5 [Trichinella zimbabwensis]|uniref:Zinc finger BED domain-containing protein 5 n=1 Tax=Trichinella zimbabwensis TaxID=268475 RepID=A0A0V1H6X8_9BILA|nr:Zinc finger BED domain-containing protein 5 [Trichinella zimbabwensis]
MELRQPISWIGNPFLSDKSTGISAMANEELIDVSEDTVLKMNFNLNKLIQFWLNVLQTHPNTSAAALKVLLPFTLSYFCEIVFCDGGH